ncbi:MAG: hypothetical protein CVU97_04940 [Firmicutes bacterium HGW-Firmicutes-21]|nr:MAG: hypothetical protein CVU97_04940 [Firmicutes bacterium HGW-Firmicutes-21]
MDELLEQIQHLQILNQLWLSLILLIPIILVARTVVAGTKFSPILIIVVFGLAMGYILVKSGVATHGLPEFPIVDFISRTTIVALTVSFFVGGQEIRKLFGKKKLDVEDMVVPSKEETILGTNRTQMVYIIRSFFLLIGIESLYRIIVGANFGDISRYYSLIAYIGIIGATILVDYKATITNKPLYIKKGIFEIVALAGIMIATYYISMAIKEVIALPQIFFAVIIGSSFGAIMYKWRFGPTVKALLFAGIPVVLAANFMVGGSRMMQVFDIKGMTSVMIYGFFGQMFWMFGGIALLMFFGKATNTRILAPGMAGSLSHSGITGACTAGDLGIAAAIRAPIMINVPFIGHIFVFSILAMSAQRGYLMMIPAVGIVAIGLVITAYSLKTIRSSGGNDANEVKGLMQFSLGFQLLAVFGGFTMLSAAGMSIGYSAMAKSSAISHFGLFAATQGGMFGSDEATMIPFIFAMPFLIHPFVFYMFGKAMQRDGEMPKLPVYILTVIGAIGVLYALISV